MVEMKRGKRRKYVLKLINPDIEPGKVGGEDRNGIQYQFESKYKGSLVVSAGKCISLEAELGNWDCQNSRHILKDVTKIRLLN